MKCIVKNFEYRTVIFDLIVNVTHQILLKKRRLLGAASLFVSDNYHVIVAVAPTLSHAHSIQS